MIFIGQKQIEFLLDLTIYEFKKVLRYPEETLEKRCKSFDA